MKITVKMKPANTIIKRLGLQENGKATKYLRDEVERLSDPYVPFQSGFLKSNTTHPSNHEIKYPDPYAHYMYMGKKAVRS